MLIPKIAKVIRNELDTYKESLSLLELKIFVGCILVQLKVDGIITSEQEEKMRRIILENK